MTGFFVTLVLVALFLAGLFLVVPARVMATGLKTVIPALLVGAGGLLFLLGRGGVGTYCHTNSVHIDIGKKRDWNWRCRRKRRR